VGINLVRYDILVIGGGATGVFTALDLTLRGLNVALVERGMIASGTSGKFHGMLHSGARYATNDPDSAKECIQENQIISSIAPHSVIDTGGLFVAIEKPDLEFEETFIKGLKENGIPFKNVTKEDVLKLEPNINPGIKDAIWVPDKVVHAMDLIMSAALTAALNGATFYTFREVVDFIKINNKIEGVKVYNRIKDRLEEIDADIIINSAGPWSAKILSKAGIKFDMLPTLGAMGVINKKLNSHILNRMRPPSDGDIIVPYSDNISIVGTTASIIEDVDNASISQDDIDLLISEGSVMIPKIKELGFIRTYYSIRPLLKESTSNQITGRTATRTFSIFDHENDGLYGLLTVSGGKLTTARLMGEKIGDYISNKINLKKDSKTRNIKLVDKIDKENAEYLSQITGLNYSFIKGIIDFIGSVDEERIRPFISMILTYGFGQVM
jgi:glycerol-3-phosphate dehydrogenase